MIQAEKEIEATALRAHSESAQNCCSNHHIASKLVPVGIIVLVLLQLVFMV